MIKEDLITLLTLVFMGLGLISFITGFIVLLTRVLGKGITQIAKETQKVVQKGITEEIASIIGNASVLIDSLNQMVTTAAGIGVFLMVLGVLLMAGSFALFLRF
ncbi:MAG: hypothetical protein IH585_05990 [Anaerolineaceae bacterium]|nr:hypothetical protein [Anaerolineaceae bacterium]PKO07497.1 MAG: hypothetical protein CVU41_02055 [Chloroflexi bacterium HGW-Chloroflexi-3]